MHRTVHVDGAAVLERVLTTCAEMLRDRGLADVARAADPVRCALQGEWVVRGGPHSDPHTLVYLCPEDKVSVKYARGVLERGADAEDRLVVSLGGPTAFTRRECEAATAARIQFLPVSFLCRNPTRHALVPAHERVDAACLPPTVAPDALPRLLETDAMVQYHRWPPGSVVRIVRHFGGHEPIVYFRTVVAGGD